MRRVFADAAYFIALLIPGDGLHAAAVRTASTSVDTVFVTADAVLGELLAYVAERGGHARRQAAGLIDDILFDPGWTVIRQTADLFDRAFGLYRRRIDKGYSLVDCTSMLVGRDLGIGEVLSHDHHFEQEGLMILL